MADNDKEPGQVPAAYRRPGKASASTEEASDSGKGIAIYHEMRRTEPFEKTAGMLWVMVHDAARKFPGKPRILYLDIEGHHRKGAKNEYDEDATELISFVRAALGPYLAETPWGKTEDAPQSDDLPDVIMVPPADGDDHVWILTGDKDNPVRRELIDGSASS
jgi:hypothetical protein